MLEVVGTAQCEGSVCEDGQQQMGPADLYTEAPSYHASHYFPGWTWSVGACRTHPNRWQVNLQFSGLKRTIHQCKQWCDETDDCVAFNAPVAMFKDPSAKSWCEIYKKTGGYVFKGDWRSSFGCMAWQHDVRPFSNYGWIPGYKKTESTGKCSSSGQKESTKASCNGVRDARLRCEAAEGCVGFHYDAQSAATDPWAGDANCELYFNPTLNYHYDGDGDAGFTCFLREKGQAGRSYGMYETTLGNCQYTDESFNLHDTGVSKGVMTKSECSDEADEAFAFAFSIGKNEPSDCTLFFMDRYEFDMGARYYGDETADMSCYTRKTRGRFMPSANEEENRLCEYTPNKVIGTTSWSDNSAEECLYDCASRDGCQGFTVDPIGYCTFFNDMSCNTTPKYAAGTDRHFFTKSTQETSWAPTPSPTATTTTTAAPASPIDFDSDGYCNPFIDGVMIIRKLMEGHFKGARLTEGLSTVPLDFEQIHNAIQHLIDSGSLDVDADGDTTALGDGLMIQRYLFQDYNGNALIDKLTQADLSTVEFGMNALGCDNFDKTEPLLV